MQVPNDNPYDKQEYDTPTVPYIQHDTAPDTSAMASPLPQTEETAGMAPITSESYAATPQPYSPEVPWVEPAAAAPPPVKKRRLPLWVILVSLLGLSIMVGAGTFWLFTYINRPTPIKTLDAFCNALVHEDYMGAYSQFSPNLQTQIPETDFAQVLAQDKVVSCTHGGADDSSNKTSTNLQLVHSSKGVNKDVVYLTRDSNNNWKITDLQKQA